MAQGRIGACGSPAADGDTSDGISYSQPPRFFEDKEGVIRVAGRRYSQRAEWPAAREPHPPGSLRMGGRGRAGGNAIVALPSNGAKLRIRLLGMKIPQQNPTECEPCSLLTVSTPIIILPSINPHQS